MTIHSASDHGYIPVTYTKPRFTIILEGAGGELDRRVADTEEEARSMVIEIAAGMAYFNGGDVIRVIENEDAE